MGHEIIGDVEANEMVHILNMETILIHKGEFEPYKLYIKKALKLELKVLPLYLKYAFLRDDDALLVILSVGLSDVQVQRH